VSPTGSVFRIYERAVATDSLGVTSVEPSGFAIATLAEQQVEVRS
jgi:hypothetical protein